MIDVINWYKENIFDEATDWLDERFSDYVDTSWDEIWDDLCMEITGNDGSRPLSYDRDIVHHVIWEPDFISYCRELDTNIGDLLEKGEEVVDCWARYMILDYFLSIEIQKYWEAKMADYSPKGSYEDIE